MDVQTHKAAFDALLERHAPLMAAAIEAVQTRRSWSPYKDSPSSKIHGAEKPEAGRKAFETQRGKPFRLDQPGIIGRVGNEISPYTNEALGIDYPRSDPEALIAAAQTAMDDWREVAPRARIALCCEMSHRLYERNFEMAHGIMHVTGQSYTQAFSGSGPNALDRGIEALAYAAKAMADVPESATWHRTFGREDVALEKTYRLVPRGIGLVICCASFPTWNAYPAMFASLATGNAVIVKPHPIAILPMAIVVRTCRQVLADYGLDPNLVTLATDTLDAPVAQSFIDHPAVQIIDFTGSPRYGSHLERTVTGKLLFTETAGVNSVVLQSTQNLAETARAIARAASLFSAQMCTSPQTVYIPKDGIVADGAHASFDDVAQALVAAIDEIANDPAMAAGIMGAVQAQASVDLVKRLEHSLDATPGARVRRSAQPYAHPDFLKARTLTPLVVAVDPSHQALYAEEHFGPILFLIAAEDGDKAVAEATGLARARGAISSYLYATDEDFIDRSVGAYERAGANLSINLHGAMWINFAAAYSDYHVTGLNPAGNACLADLAFVAGRFRIVQRRRPMAQAHGMDGQQ
ncbi:MAG TPA: phenylacetic acid degradation protein PaaN [Beijerinckiaceae bacterium]|nr:phenylacetic acid degradation protein PaaN [Beijerinckiaceae bacterium]